MYENVCETCNSGHGKKKKLFWKLLKHLCMKSVDFVLSYSSLWKLKFIKLRTERNEVESNECAVIFVILKCQSIQCKANLGANFIICVFTKKIFYLSDTNILVFFLTWAIIKLVLKSILIACLELLIVFLILNVNTLVENHTEGFC